MNFVIAKAGDNLGTMWTAPAGRGGKVQSGGVFAGQRLGHGVAQ